MKLDDFLKCKKVKCVEERGEFLTIGKEYDVLDRCVEIKITDDEGYSFWFDNDHFEPVLDSAETPLQNIELTPEFEVVEPTFKVGDKVYKYGETDVKTVLEVFEDGYMRISNYPHRVNHEVICHATPENHALLSKPFPAIEFEQPPKPLTGSDLARAMLDKGWHLVPCVVSDVSDSDALNNDNCCLVDEWWVGSFDSCFNSGDYSYKYAVPFDPRTGEPLTEAVLDE